jgi:cold shock CspA family protein
MLTTSAASKTLLLTRSARASMSRSIFAANTSGRFFSTGDGDEQFVKGTVVQYDSGRGYGFVRLEGSNEQVFVHRSEIISDIPVANLPFRFPYLRRGETVSFATETHTDESSGEAINKLRANKVAWSNRDPIPAVRKNFLSSLDHRNAIAMGRALQRVMNDEDSALTDAQKFQALKTSYQNIQRNMDEAIAMLQNLGLDPEEFKVDPKKKRKGGGGKSDDDGNEGDQ